MKRREFFAATGGLLLVAACGGDDDGSGGPDAGAASFTITNADASGHTHTLTVFCIDLTAQSPVTYTTGVGDSHTHSVMVTGDELMRIADGETVTVEFTDGHAHTFMIAKPAGECS